MPKTNEKIAALQKEIADKTQALRSILEAEHQAAKALVAETEEALAVLGGKPSRRPAVVKVVAPTRGGAVGRAPVKLNAAREVLRKHGRLSARQMAAIMGTKTGWASSFLTRMRELGEAEVVDKITQVGEGGPRAASVYALVDGKA